MLTKRQVIQAVEGAERLASAIGQTTTEVLRKTLATPERKPPQRAAKSRLVVMQQKGAA